MGTLSLFEDMPGGFDRALLQRNLAALAAEGVLIGGSSWKYEGWLDQIYETANYRVRGKFSKRRFEEECLAEYAATFPIVCGDFSFYQFPSEAFWRKLFLSAGPALRFAFKVPEEITAKVFPIHPRYGARAGDSNPSFLNAALFEAAFLGLLMPYRGRVPVLIFEFGHMAMPVDDFLEALDAFLERLPREFRYAIEVRNEDFLVPQYFACLREHGIAHVLNAWSRMPELDRQLQLPGVFSAPFTVVRALLRRGRPYEKAVEAFAPYREIQDPNPETRQAIREVIQRARDLREPSYIFVNNRLEGNAPGTIESLVG